VATTRGGYIDCIIQKWSKFALNEVLDRQAEHSATLMWSIWTSHNIKLWQ